MTPQNDRAMLQPHTNQGLSVCSPRVWGRMLQATDKSLNAQRLLLLQQALLSSVASTGIIGHSLQHDCRVCRTIDIRVLLHTAVPTGHTAVHWLRPQRPERPERPEPAQHPHSGAPYTPPVPHSTCDCAQQQDDRLDKAACLHCVCTFLVLWTVGCISYYEQCCILKCSGCCFGVSHMPFGDGVCGVGWGTVHSHLWSGLLLETCIVMYRDVSKHVFRERTLNTSRYKRDTYVSHRRPHRYNPRYTTIQATGGDEVRGDPRMPIAQHAAYHSQCYHISNPSLNPRSWDVGRAEHAACHGPEKD